eukprot:355353-Chlamydomonas_euryale.AAC.8
MDLPEKQVHAHEGCTYCFASNIQAGSASCYSESRLCRHARRQCNPKMQGPDSQGADATWIRHEASNFKQWVVERRHYTADAAFSNLVLVIGAAGERGRGASAAGTSSSSRPRCAQRQHSPWGDGPDQRMGGW